ncbi:hypothetical protein ACFYY8_11045 [Streptosporangium sp. NPDC001559]|uniref:hypothetical protein n=1 Tax=Streptosporangium sp. NPDC001559 TaxID=3366187 RepID=UPI0036E796C5
MDYDLVSRSQVPPEAGKLFSEKDLERLRSPLHAIKVGRHTYVSGLRPDRMSEGEDWLRFGDEVLWGAKGQRGSQVLDILDPAVLRKLIARSVSPRPGEYRGAITTDELYGEGTWGVRKVSYRLFVDADQLPVRLVTESSEKVTLALEEGTKGVRRTEHAVVDTHYRGWGAKTTITAPSRSENVTAESLMTQLYLPLSPVPIGPGGPVGDGRPR